MADEDVFIPEMSVVSIKVVLIYDYTVNVWRCLLDAPIFELSLPFLVDFGGWSCGLRMEGYKNGCGGLSDGTAETMNKLRRR